MDVQYRWRSPWLNPHPPPQDSIEHVKKAFSKFLGEKIASILKFRKEWPKFEHTTSNIEILFFLTKNYEICDALGGIHRWSTTLIVPDKVDVVGLLRDGTDFEEVFCKVVDSMPSVQRKVPPVSIVDGADLAEGTCRIGGVRAKTRVQYDQFGSGKLDGE